jgi:predicted dehydrogenase
VKSRATPSAWAPRIALIGCGAIAENYYLPALTAHPSVLNNLILVDSDKARLDKLSTEFKVNRKVLDYREILGEADGIILALPTGLHAPIGIEFLARGIPVLCEKPLAENASNGRCMIEAADRANTALAVNYLQRLIPHFGRVKQLLDRQVYGRPLSLDYVIGEIFDWPTVSGFYFKSEPSTRGILRDRGSHAVDHICWWLGGKPQVVSSRNDSFGGSEAVAHVEFEHEGCMGRLTLSWFADVPCRFVIRCEGATIEGDIYDYHRLNIIEGGRKRKVILNSPLQTKLDVAKNIVTNFILVIEKKETPLVSAADVLESVEFVDDCYTLAVPFDMPWYRVVERQHVG